MKIIKEGDLSRITTAKQFDCPECGCVWEASAGEYRRETLDGKALCICLCPTCRKEVHMNDGAQTPE